MSAADSTRPVDFIREIVADDLRTGKNGGRVRTRFPPEPNGYLHIGHAKSICLNFGVAAEFGGTCNLRFDDTNPEKESTEYVESIISDVRWLGFDWGDRLFHASDYFQRLYDYAIELVRRGDAYVCDLTADQIREYRGSLTEPGRNSPYRDRSVEENLDLFRRMRAGEFAPGERVLRAKIDMASGNVNLRDPVMYRLMDEPHYRTGRDWPIYPMYDFTHCLSDAIEGITHSLCTLEFEANRPLYDWFLDRLQTECHPRQIEFARLNLSYTVLSKRRLKLLVDRGMVSGWDDPRLPTISGMRRRGFTPEAIRGFCDRIGVAKANSLVDIALLEYHLREDLNKRAPRAMAVLDPLKLVITNYPEDKVEEVIAENNPEDRDAGTRKIPFSGEIYIEREDFQEEPHKKFFRLAPGREVRLKHAYYVTCNEVIKDGKTGQIIELRCSHDPESRGGWTADERKVQGTLHWVSAPHSIPAEVRLYDRLFVRENPEEVEEGKEFTDYINPDSLHVIDNCRLEPSLARAAPGDRFQFLRKGYFCADPDSAGGRPVFNRTLPLRDTWAKIERKG